MCVCVGALGIARTDRVIMLPISNGVVLFSVPSINCD